MTLVIFLQYLCILFKLVSLLQNELININYYLSDYIEIIWKFLDINTWWRISRCSISDDQYRISTVSKLLRSKHSWKSTRTETARLHSN